MAASETAPCPFVFAAAVRRRSSITAETSAPNRSSSFFARAGPKVPLDARLLSLAGHRSHSRRCERWHARSGRRFPRLRACVRGLRQSCSGIHFPTGASALHDLSGSRFRGDLAARTGFGSVGSTPTIATKAGVLSCPIRTRRLSSGGAMQIITSNRRALCRRRLIRKRLSAWFDPAPTNGRFWGDH